jgi:hypothetical protein
MFTTNGLIENLEISIKNLKSASMLNKPKFAEQCVTDALVCIKEISLNQNKQTQGLVDLHKRLDAHIKTGK